jgi:hypothetical protein
MKVRPSKAYLVIGSAHLGIDLDIVMTFATVAKQYKAELIHLGPITDAPSIDRFHALKDKMGRRHEAEAVKRQEEWLVKLFEDTFGKVTYVLSSGQSVSMPDGKKTKVVEHEMPLGGHLSLSAVPPTGDKVTASPISKKSRNYYKNRGSSWILPHPTPSVESFPREGLNQAWNYYTTGSLKNPERPANSGDMYQSYNLPCAVLVIIDSKSGEFHARPLHVDYIRSEVSHRLEPMVIDDGLVFSRHGVIEVESEDKACHSTDDHSPYNHLGVLAATRAQNELHQPVVFINGGDASDMEPVSRHTKDVPLARENLRLRDALCDLRDLLDAQTNVKSIKKKILVDSNHHEWLSAFVAENPSLEGWLDWNTLSKDMFSDWDLFLRTAGENKTFKFGDLACRHGDKEQPQQAQEIFGKYLGGHYHRYRVLGRTFSVGPGCRLGPKYLQNSVTAWQNQITTLTKYKGKASCAPKTVLHDESLKKSRFSYQAQIFEVDFYKKT